MSLATHAMRRSAALLAGAWMILADAAPAGAACAEEGPGRPSGPSVAGVLDGDLGLGRRVCGRSEVGLGAGGILVADTFNFYGNISGGLTIDGSAAFLGGRGEVFGSLQVLRYESVIHAPSASAIGLGPATFGGMFRLLDRERVALGVHGRMLIPVYAGIYQNAVPIGGDVGLGLLVQPHRRVRVHAGVGGLLTGMISAGAANARGGAALAAAAEWVPAEAFSLQGGLQAGFGYAAPLDVLAATAALRFGDRKRFGFELAAAVPLAGRDPSDVSIDLRATVQLGSLGR